MKIENIKTLYCKYEKHFYINDIASVFSDKWNLSNRIVTEEFCPLTKFHKKTCNVIPHVLHYVTLSINRIRIIKHRTVKFLTL